MKKINYFIMTLAVAGALFTACKKKKDVVVDPPATGGGGNTTVLLTDFDHNGRIAACYLFGSASTSDSVRNSTTPAAHSGTGYWKVAGTCGAGTYYLDGFGGTDGAALNLDMNDSITFWINTRTNSASYIQLQLIDNQSYPATGTCAAITGEGFVKKFVETVATNGWVKRSACVSELVSDPYQVPSACYTQMTHTPTPNLAACAKIGFTVGDAGSGVPVEVNVDDISIVRVP